MKRLLNYITLIKNEIDKDDLISAGNDLTYKLFFSIFPLLTFLTSIIGFLSLDAEMIFDKLKHTFPQDLWQSMQYIINNITQSRRTTVLSLSIIITLYSASSGFATAIRSINKVYDVKDTRRLLYKWLIRFLLVIIFTLTIILAFGVLLFGDQIIRRYNHNIWYETLIVLILYILRLIIPFLIVTFSVALINKLSLSVNTKLCDHYPGALITSAIWIAVGSLFDYCIMRFVNYSALYGSMATAFILLLWLNIMCIALLIGSEINSMLYNK